MRSKKVILPWLKKDPIDGLNDRINKTVISELQKRFWGDSAAGSSAGGGKRILINDFRGLMLAVGTIRYYLAKYNVKLLYRGQSQDWDLKPSLFRNITNKKRS